MFKDVKTFSKLKKTAKIEKHFVKSGFGDKSWCDKSEDGQYVALIGLLLININYFYVIFDKKYFLKIL